MKKPSLPQKKILRHMMQGFLLFSPRVNFTSWAWLMSPIDSRCSNVHQSVFRSMRKQKMIIPADTNGDFIDDEWVINEEVINKSEIKSYFDGIEKRTREILDK